MKGLYVNASLDALSNTLALIRSHLEIRNYRFGEDTVTLVFDKSVWSEKEHYSKGGNNFLISGWFVFENKLNDFEALCDSLLDKGTDALKDISAGAYIIYWHDGNESLIINDFLGLSTHFFDSTEEKLKIAPAVLPLYNSSVHSENPSRKEILSGLGCLYGNYTLYDGIERIPPNTMLKKSEQVQIPFDWESTKQIEDTNTLFRNILDLLPKKEKLLPLSSGLDSRLILASSEFVNSFTYGPKNSPEVAISKKAGSSIKNHLVFDYTETDFLQSEPEVLNEMAFGILKPIPRLLTNYQFVKTKFPHCNYACDGYLGDVFQRGTFITFKGLLGEIFKLFPFIYKLKKFSAKFILRRRYKLLTDKQFELVWADYESKTGQLNLNDYQKVTYYEFLYGRGGRFAYFGGNALNGQFFSIVSPFAIKDVFVLFIRSDISDLVSYKALRKIWKNADSKLTDLAVESGYKPKTNYFLIPYIQFVFRALFHLIPSRANYAVQLKRTGQVKRL